MAISPDEARATLNLLVAIAKADGTVHDDEKKSLAAALESFELPAGTTLEKLLEAKVDVDGELGKLADGEAKAQAFRSAFFMAYADGSCAPEEAAIVDKVAAHANVSEDEKKRLAQLFVPRPSKIPLGRGTGMRLALGNLMAKLRPSKAPQRPSVDDDNGIAKLTQELREGKISQEDFDKRLAELC
jgi:tellurite resistance protein